VETDTLDIRITFDRAMDQATVMEFASLVKDELLDGAIGGGPWGMGLVVRGKAEHSVTDVTRLVEAAV